MKLKKLIKKMPKDTPLQLAGKDRTLITNVHALYGLPYYKELMDKKVKRVGVTPGGLIFIDLKGVNA